MRKVLFLLSLLLLVSFANAQIVENNQNIENKEFQSYRVGMLNIRDYSGNYFIKASNNLILGTSFAAAAGLFAVFPITKRSYTNDAGVLVKEKSYAMSYAFGAASLGFVCVAFPLNLKKAGKALNVENGRYTTRIIFN
ncbi:MAG: hypothetical protein FWC39_09945 [Bacteroidetes bacterium]|nr:hypothetical protein [Bacteroidota bacterium]